MASNTGCLFHRRLGGPQTSFSWCILILEDLTGPSLEGSKYYIVFIDDLARMCWIYFLRFKSEVANVFWRFKSLVENQSGRKMMIIRSINGKEYTSDHFNRFCGKQE